MPVLSNFQIWGSKISSDFIVPNKTEQTTEDILLVQTGYTTKIVRFFENFVSLDFWFEMKKNLPCRYGQIGVKTLTVILWFRMQQNGLLKTFHQC